MAKDINYYFQVPIIKFSIHIALWAMIIFNISSILNYNLISIQNSKKEEEFSGITNRNNILKSQEDYWNSSLYVRKFAKTNNYKISGEEVVNTFRIENPELENSIYYPDTDINQKGKLRNWYECLLEVDDDYQLKTFLC